MPAYQLIVAPAAEPVSLATAKLWVRQDSDADDALLAGLIVAARDQCETYTQRAFVTQTWRLTLDAFPGYLDYRGAASESVRTTTYGAWSWLGNGWGFALPFPPVQSIVSLKYNNSVGVQTTLVPSVDYIADLASSPARIFPVFGRFWPFTQYAPDAVTVDFVCGYGDPSTVPQSICTAILMLVSHWYTNRDAVVITTAVAAEMPLGVKALLGPYRQIRF